MIMEIDFITSNKGKIAALKRSFLNAGRFDIKVNQVQADIVEPQLNNIADVSKYKAMEAFKILKKPILVEDGGLVIEALNGFPGPYTKYVLSTIGIDGILKLMNGENNRAAKFVSFATFVGNDGTVCQFERFGDNFEIAYERKNVIHPDAWSDLWQVMYMKDYEMLRNCGESYAMENAHDEIKKVAKYIAPSNDDEGVMQVLKKIL